MMEIVLNQPYSFCQLGRRANQEDARFPDTDAPQDYRPAFIVCDGVGGCDKGEMASRIVADTIGESIQSYDLSKHFDSIDFGDIMKIVLRNVETASRQSHSDMATTMTFLCFHAGGAFAAHIGDSRIYQVRPNVGIIYRSEDHSLVNALVHSGNITPEEALTHPQRNVITRCISASRINNVSVTTCQIDDIEPGDYFFLCTDGVLHNVSDHKLVEILSSNTDDKEKIDKIALLSELSSDNNTAYLIRVDSVIKEEDLTADAGRNIDSRTRLLEIQPSECSDILIQYKKRTIKTQITDFLNKLFL